MNEEASWNPASGCFQCPISIDLEQSWAGINPLPCFMAPGRGYFSVPLSAWYVPLLFVDNFPDVAIGEVNNDQVRKFYAIAHHEKWHVEKGIIPVKGLIRLIAGRAYQGLYEIIFEKNSKAWEILQLHNSVITQLIKSMALVEELTATLIGCEHFREMESVQSHKDEVDKIEEEFVQAQSQLFRPDYKKLYGQLVKIYRKFGDGPIRILSNYSMDWLEVEYLGKQVGIQAQKINEETTRARLDRCLDLFSNVSELPQAEQWTREHWFDFFTDRLIDYRRWGAGRQELHRFLDDDLSINQKWWADRGFSGYENPSATAEHISNAPLNNTVIHTIQGIAPMDTADPEEQQVEQMLNNYVRLASEQNRTLVKVAPPEDNTSIGFMPRVDKHNQGVSPFACISRAENVRASIPPGMRLIDELGLRTVVSNLVFFEGLRIMAATGVRVHRGLPVV